MSYWTGDEWRWHLTSDGPRSVYVIEPTAATKAKRSKRDRKRREKGASKVPFGFGRALVEARNIDRKERR